MIILYGFAASGKTTIAKRYTDQHPLSIAIEGDQIIGMIGQWRKNESEARGLVFEHTKSIADKHLQAGYDVIVPYLLNDAKHSNEFEGIATRNIADFHEVYIEIEKEDAVNRLILRGCWGEEGSRKLTENDRAELISRYEYMEVVMQERTNIKSISSQVGKIEETYQELLEAIQ